MSDPDDPAAVGDVAVPVTTDIDADIRDVGGFGLAVEKRD
jgi:hypothetical protein